MKLFTHNLTVRDLENFAEEMGIQIYNVTDEGVRERGKYKDMRVIRFVLRPLHNSDDTYRLIRDNPYAKSGSGKRRVWAISWQGHWDFMVKVFNHDPFARIESAIATYDGEMGFYQNAPETAYRNIGSMMYPQYYGEACA